MTSRLRNPSTLLVEDTYLFTLYEGREYLTHNLSALNDRCPDCDTTILNEHHFVELTVSPSATSLMWWT